MAEALGSEAMTPEEAGLLRRVRVQLALWSGGVALVLLLLLGVAELRHVGAPGSSFAVHGHADPFVTATLGIALLFVCGSLPLFLGAEVAGGSRTIRRALPVAGVLAAGYVTFAVFAFAAVDPSVRTAELPGYAIAGAYSGRTLAIVVGVGAAASVSGLIVAEYLALSRLLFAFTGVPVRRVLRGIAVPFIALDALSLINPEWFDEHVLRPSLTRSR